VTKAAHASVIIVDGGVQIDCGGQVMITLVPARAGQTQGLGIRYGKAVGTSIGEVAVVKGHQLTEIIAQA